MLKVIQRSLMGKFKVWIMILAVGIIACENSQVSSPSGSETCSLKNTIKDSEDIEWEISTKVGEGAFGRVYKVDIVPEEIPPTPSLGCGCFRFKASPADPLPRPPQEPKVLKISIYTDEKNYEGFIKAEDLMATLPKKGLPFIESEKVSLNFYQQADYSGYLKPFMQASLRRLRKSLPTSFDPKSVGGDIAQKYKTITTIQSSKKNRLEGVLIDDIGWTHGGNGMFDDEWNFKFIDMQDFFELHPYLKPNLEVIHEKAFLEQWNFMQGFSYIKRDRLKENDDIIQGFIDEFKKEASDSLLVMIEKTKVIDSQMTLWNWRMDEFLRLLDKIEITPQSLTAGYRNLLLDAAGTLNNRQAYKKKLGL